MAKIAFIWDGKRCTYNGQTDPLKPGKPIAFKARFRACLNLNPWRRGLHVWDCITGAAQIVGQPRHRGALRSR